MKGLGRRLTVLAMLGVLAVAMVGAAHTLWFEELQMNVAAATGTLDGKIICGVVGDNDDLDSQNPLQSPGYSDPNPANVVVNDIGEITFSGPVSPPSDPNHGWVITVANAYPGYAVECKIVLENVGTVPWHIETETVEIFKNNVLQDFVHDFQCDLTVCSQGDISPGASGATNDPLWVVLGDVRGCQIHPGDPLSARSTSLHLGVNQSANPNAVYQVRLKFQINQWNESGWRDCGKQWGPISLQPQ